MKKLDKHAIVRLISVGGFVAVFAGGFVHFWTGAGGSIPGITGRGQYQISFVTDQVKNLRRSGDASIAGVVVGSVKDETLDGSRTKVTLSLDPDVAPLHQGATVRIGLKSIVGQSYVDIVDGEGTEIPAGGTLPDQAVIEPVDVDEVLGTFDPKTRKALSGTIRSLAATTHGTSGSLDQLMTGLGSLGREGYTAVDAIAAQSDDLRSLVRETTTLMNALDSGQGQIASVVSDARQLTMATSQQKDALAHSMRSMPSFLATARSATGSLTGLGGALAPVAADLRKAAPDLNVALAQLPSTTRDLQGLVPDLDATLTTAPATLKRVPAVGSDLHALLPAAQVTLGDINPMLDYLKPYGRDIGAMFANFGASMDVVSENGVRPIRVAPIFNTRSLAGNPLPLKFDPLHWNNPYPAPGQAGNPSPFKGSYPQVRSESK